MPSNAQDDDVEGFAVAVVRDEAKWIVASLSNGALLSLHKAETEIKSLRSVGATFGLLNVDDEFFIVVRPGPSGSRLMISDASAALDYDIAADVLDELNVTEIDDVDVDSTEPWPEGDLGILADLGLEEPVLAVIVGDEDLYADEQIQMIAERLGFADELAKAVPTK